MTRQLNDRDLHYGLTGPRPRDYLPFMFDGQETDPLHGRHGFTVAEMLVAIAIFGILAAIALPAWNTLLPDYALSGAVRQVQSELHRTRSRAVSQNTSFQFKVLSAPSTSYQIDDGVTTETKPLSEGIAIIDTVDISFTSRGTASGDTVKIQNSKGECTNVVVSGTGRVRVCEPSSCGGSC